ncbi:NUDIX domain-containing protein [Arthrobacter sp. ATA002]|uniref:NUDIX domain-containing protein n=1 Tax=Arthrobacter sp. ATA002 TaxID=2991715 RepID=UPI003FA40843
MYKCRLARSRTGESPEEAALRELLEETGRQGCLVRSVGIQRYDLRPARNEIAVRHYFQLSMPDADLTERWSAGEPDSSLGGETSAGPAGGCRSQTHTS